MVKNKVYYVLLYSILIFSCRDKNYFDSPLKNVLLIQNQGNKINGITLWMDEHKPTEESFKLIKNTHANWVCITPYCVLEKNTAEIKYNQPNFWYGFELDAITYYTQQIKKQGAKVFLKPHIMLQDFDPTYWHGNIDFTSEKDWIAFENSYFLYLKTILSLADSLNIEAVSLGVELKSFIANRPTQWISFLDTARTIYNGLLTYCANWDNYQKINFWNKLDFIGIDFYFSTSTEKTPTINSCFTTLDSINNELKLVANSKELPIVLTEYGYQSRNYAGLDPWNKKLNTNINYLGQENAYGALFNTLWDEPYIAGGFSWIWFLNEKSILEAPLYDYTPQNKPAELLIQDFFAKQNSN